MASQPSIICPAHNWLAAAEVKQVTKQQAVIKAKQKIR
jgi:hypothetical protein